MSVTTRLFSTGFWTSELAEHDLPDIEERMLWMYLRTNLSTVPCGFFQFSPATASAQALIPFQRITEIIAKLDQTLKVIVYDRGYIFIPGYHEEQSEPNWVGTPGHIRKQHKQYLSGGGRPDNRAFLAFTEHFKAILESDPPQTRKKKKNPAEPKGTAQGGAPSPNGSSAAVLSSNGAIHSTQPPAFDVVKTAWREWRSLEGVAFEGAEIVAEEFFRVYQKKGWPADWMDKINVWVSRRWQDQNKREGALDEGRQLPSGKRLAL